jgi:hypothetical protein
LLELAFDTSPGPKSIISASNKNSDILKQIIKDWGLEAPKKATVSEMERVVFSSQGCHLFVDDLQQSRSSQKIKLFSKLADLHKVYGVVEGPIKDNIQPVVSKLGHELKIRVLDKKTTLDLSKRVCIHFSSSLSHGDVANASGGNPGKIVIMAVTDEILRKEIRGKTDEIIIGGIVGLIFLCLATMKYMARYMEDNTDLAIVGIVSLFIGYVIRPIFR